MGASVTGQQGVELGKGQTLSVRLQNLERAEKPAAGEASAAAAAAPPTRTGGSWDDVASYARVAFRNLHDPSDRYGRLGFRLTRTLP